MIVEFLLNVRLWMENVILPFIARMNLQIFQIFPDSNFYFHKFRKENILRERMRKSFFLFFLALRYLILIFLGTREKIKINILFVRYDFKGYY